MKVLDFFKRVIGIFGFKNSLERLGIKNVVSEKMTGCINRWTDMYEGNMCGRLNLPAAIASEVARLATVELKSSITGSKRADLLNDGYCEIIDKIRNITEYAAAKGGVILKPYIDDGKVKVGFVQAENFIPTSYDTSQCIDGAAFLDRRFNDGKVYTRIEHHCFIDGKYCVRNYVFESYTTSDLGRRIDPAKTDFWRDISSQVIMEGVKKPLFAYFKMPMANITDSSSPLGTSVYAKCEALIDDAEKQYDRLLWEFKSGERALYVDTNAVKRDENGKAILPDERLYKLLNADDTLFKDWTPTLREKNIINGLNEILRKIEFNSGLAYGTLSNVETTDKTAEEIRASKQRSYATVCDIQKSLQNALCALCEAMDTLADLYELAPSGACSVSFEFDDSIAADRKAEFTEKLQLISAGIMAPWEFRMWYFGEDEEKARLILREQEFAKEKTKW